MDLSSTNVASGLVVDPSSVINKLKSCLNYKTMLSMEPDFNSVGLTIQQSVQGWAVLCRIVDGRPSAGSVVNDYIFLTTLDKSDAEPSERAISIISDFVLNHAGQPSTISDLPNTEIFKRLQSSF
jgi:hypothetical protein